MATKKKKSTKTAKKTIKRTTSRKAANKTVSPKEKWHVYIVTALSFIAAILLATDVAMINIS